MASLAREPELALIKSIDLVREVLARTE